MTIFSAGARVTHSEVVAETIDITQNLRTITNEISFAQRLGDLTIFNEVGLGHSKDKVSSRSIDTAATKVSNIDTVGCVLNNVGRVFLTIQNIRIRHTHHGQVFVRLTTTVSTLRTTLVASTQVVPHVVSENSIFDQHVVLRRMAFVINGDRSPFMRHRAVVDQCHERRSDEFTNFALVHTGAFGNKVSFKAVTTCLMEQHSAASGLDHDWQRTRWRRACLQLGERPTSRGARHIFHLNFVEKFKTHRVAERVKTSLHAGVTISHCTHAQQCANAFIMSNKTVTIGNHNSSTSIGVTSRHL